MDPFNEDILSFWDCLYKNDVKYIMIGGFAINLHGYNRATNDIDIWIEDTLDNRKRLRKALKEQGSGDYSPIETMDFIPGWTDFQLNMGFKLDVMSSVKGLETIGFEECFKYAIVTEIEHTIVRFLHYNHLITCKKATGRRKDLLDIEELEKIRKAGKGNNP
jgi:hypothetical protein